MKTNNRNQKSEDRSQKSEAGFRNPWLASGRAYSAFLLRVLCVSAVTFDATAQVTTNRIQFRRGLDAERVANVFAAGEPAWSTDTQKLWLGDDATPGGLGVTMDSDLAWATNAAWNTTTNWIVGQLYVTASVTNGLASTGFVTGQGYVTASVTNGLASLGRVDAATNAVTQWTRGTFIPIGSNFIFAGSGVSVAQTNGNFYIGASGGVTLDQVWNAIGGSMTVFRPVNSVLPAISGSVNTGQTVSVSYGTWTSISSLATAADTNRSGVWVDDMAGGGAWGVLGGATSFTITNGIAAGQVLFVIATWTNIVGVTSAVSTEYVVATDSPPATPDAPVFETPSDNMDGTFNVVIDIPSLPAGATSMSLQVSPDGGTSWPDQGGVTPGGTHLWVGVPYGTGKAHVTANNAHGSTQSSDATVSFP